MDYLLFRFQTFDAAEVTKEIIENISNRIPRFSRAYNRRKSVISRGGYSFHEEEEEWISVRVTMTCSQTQAGLIAIERAVAFATVWFEV